jgi:hypothetical protein
MRGAAWIVLGIGGETRILKDDPNSVQGKGVRHPPFEAQDKLKLRPPKEIGKAASRQREVRSARENICEAA